MALLLKVYKNLYCKKILCLYVFPNMRTCNLFTKNLINYYDLTCKRTEYITYKRFFKIESISMNDYYSFREIERYIKE